MFFFPILYCLFSPSFFFLQFFLTTSRLACYTNHSIHRVQFDDQIIKKLYVFFYSTIYFMVCFYLLNHVIHGIFKVIGNVSKSTIRCIFIHRLVIRFMSFLQVHSPRLVASSFYTPIDVVVFCSCGSHLQHNFSFSESIYLLLILLLYSLLICSL